MILSLFLNFKFHQCLNQKCLMLLYCIIKNIIGVFSIIFFLYSIQRWFVDGLYKFSMYGSVAWGRQVGGFNSSFLALVKFLEKHAPWQWNICLSLVIRMQALKRREIRAIDSKISEPYILSSMKIELTLCLMQSYGLTVIATARPFTPLISMSWRSLSEDGMWDEKTIQALIARLREKLITWTFFRKTCDTLAF